MSLYLIAEIRVKPRFHTQAREALVALVAPTLQEPGCRTFEVLQGRPADNRLWLYECWDDDDALAFHYAQDYTKAVFAAYEEWLAEPVRVVHLDRLAPGS